MSCTSSIVSPMQSTRVPFTKERMMYESKGSTAARQHHGLLISVNTSTTLTVLLHFCRPHRVRNTRQVGADDLLNLETVPQHAECTPRSAPTSGEDLGCVRVRQQVHDLGVEDGAERLHLIDHGEVVQGTWSEVRKGKWGGRIGHAEGWVRGRRELWFVVVVTKFLELVQVAVETKSA